MDLASLKAMAAEETTRLLLEKHGFVPDSASEEWEDEYRRQFALAKVRQQQTTARRMKPAPAAIDSAFERTEWPELSGPPAETRWALSLRADRLKEIQSEELRAWLARAWTSAKDWVGTRELSAAAFLRRVEAQYAEERRQLEQRTAALEAERQAKAAAASAIAQKIEAAGITAQGLVDLVDVSPRTKAAPIKAKLAELNAGDRRLRIFETVNPTVLLVIESGAAGRTDYGIEHDAGLVADLKLFAEAGVS
jgi:hypothetical protein